MQSLAQTDDKAIARAFIARAPEVLSGD